MKEIKKEFKREVVETTTVYQASDGTEFNSKEECQKYENSAAGVLLAKIATFSTETPNSLDDCDENEYKLVIPTNDEELDALNQLYFLFGGRNSKELFFTKEYLNRPVLMGYRRCCESIDWCWFYKLDDFIKESTQDKFILMPKP